MTDLEQVALAAAILIAVVLRRAYGEPVHVKRVILLPPIMLVAGVANLAHHAPAHVSPRAIGILVISGVIAILTGVARGATVRLFARRGYLWQRYRPITLLLWAVLTPIHFLIDQAGSHSLDDAALLLLLALTLFGEVACVLPRALRTGVPFAPVGVSSTRSALTQLLEPRSEHARHRGSRTRP